jgi:hypothetical protein
MEPRVRSTEGYALGRRRVCLFGVGALVRVRAIPRPNGRYGATHDLRSTSLPSEPPRAGLDGSPEFATGVARREDGTPAAPAGCVDEADSATTQRGAAAGTERWSDHRRRDSITPQARRSGLTKTLARI